MSEWRKSRRSGGATNCVELSRDGHVRDSKNPQGPTLDARGLLALAKSVERER